MDDPAKAEDEAIRQQWRKIIDRDEDLPADIAEVIDQTLATWKDGFMLTFGFESGGDIWWSVARSVPV